MSLARRLSRLAGRSPPRLLILSYADGTDDPAPRGLDQDQFTRQMQLVAQRFAPIALSSLMSYASGKKRLAGPQVCVLLRSESVDHYLAADSILRSLGSRCTYVVGFEHGVGGDDLDPAPAVDAAVLRELAAGGADFATQLHSRSPVATLATSTRRRILAAMRRRIERETGTEVHALVHAGWPDGAPERTLIYDAAIAGFSLGVCGSGPANTLRPLDPMRLRCSNICRTTPPERVESLLNALVREA
jgi:hypothetical protein